MSARGDHHGLVVVDKPGEWTSHDIVARIRRLAGMRRVGHAGTLDPMATGVLLLGLGKATRLLGHLTLTDKAYRATIRLGWDTNTDDAEGEPGRAVDASGVDDRRLRAEVAALTGEIEQVPPQVSAVKVDGERSYAAVRKGRAVALQSRTVRVSAFTIGETSADPTAGTLDLTAEITCSSGTYVRALARDLGAALGVGGHLTALRRTRVGQYGLEQAHTLERLEEDFTVLPLAQAVAAGFPTRVLTPAEAKRVGHGNRIAATDGDSGPVGLFTEDGAVLALAENRSDHAQPTVVFG